MRLSSRGTPRQEYGEFGSCQHTVRRLALTTVSSTANTTGVNVTQFGSPGLTLVFDCSATAGAGSLAIAVEASTDDSTYAAVSGATTTVAASGVTILFVPNFSGTYLRLAQVLSGTSVTYSCIIYGQPADTTTETGHSNSPGDTPA